MNEKNEPASNLLKLTFVVKTLTTESKSTKKRQMQAALIYASGGKSKAAALLEAGYSRSTAMHCADRTFAAINRNLDGASALADDRLGVGPITGGKWKNHGQFVRSVGDTATRFQKAGLITGAQRGQSSRRQLDLGVESKAP